MYRKVFLLSFLVTVSFVGAWAQIPPIGQWREHLNYLETIQVVKGNQIYCATTTNVFGIDEQNEVTRYSKVTGLNDIGVQAIAWDASSSQLVIAYTNSNLDILKGNQTRNIGDIQRSSFPGNKNIQHIYCTDGLAYLSTGLGIIVVNLTRHEIKDTWLIGTNGSPVSVNGVTTDGLFFYAATDQGLKRAPRNSPDLANFSNWPNISGSNGLPPGNYHHVVSSNNRIVAQKKDSLFISTDNAWNLLYADTAWSITSITSSENKILLCQKSISGNARVVVLNTNGIIERTITQKEIIAVPKSAILDNGAVWVADQLKGLSRSGTTTERFIPNGPPGIASGDLVVQNHILHAASGGIDANRNPTLNHNGVFRFQNDLWSSQSFLNFPILDSVFDLIALAIDPRDESIWAGSFGGGLVQLKPNQVRIFKQNNSSLQPARTVPGSYRVSGLAFDANQNLWISNDGAAQNLHVRKSGDSLFKAFTIPFAHLNNAVSQIVVDDEQQIWIVSPQGNGIFCYNPGQNIDNTNDDQWKFYRQGAGNGNLPSNQVNCLLKDQNGFIWVGTDRGIGIISCTNEVFSATGCDALLPVVQQDRFAGLLFSDENVQCMAVDGANRKWIGTKNGAWLIGADGKNILFRFTAENSPLLANDVKKITVDPDTGEVFFATSNGICSFRSTATEGSSTNENILVFPNPVPPGYTGTIAIRGLVKDALVKITELNGRLVYQARSLGGQLSWNGLLYNGAKPASGIYLVIVRDDAGTEKIVTKIVLTSGR